MGTSNSRIPTNAKSAAETKILSTNGSTIAPKGVMVLVSRAILPSTQSVLAATIKISVAIRRVQPHGIKIKINITIDSAARVSVILLGSVIIERILQKYPPEAIGFYGYFLTPPE